METQRCYHCHEVQPVVAFGRDASRKNGLAVWCRHCSSEYQKRRRGVAAALRPDLPRRANPETNLAARKKAQAKAPKRPPTPVEPRDGSLLGELVETAQETGRQHVLARQSGGRSGSWAQYFRLFKRLRMLKTTCREAARDDPKRLLLGFVDDPKMPLRMYLDERLRKGPCIACGRHTFTYLYNLEDCGRRPKLSKYLKDEAMTREHLDEILSAFVQVCKRCAGPWHPGHDKHDDPVARGEWRLPGLRRTAQ